jgi:hypothetical protein
MSIILLWLLITYFNKKTFGKSLVRTGLIYLLICLPILLATGGKTGLTRLTQEWQLRLPGYTMDTDYARASCYLGFNKNPLITKVCYVFWNKPISLISAIATSGLKQLSPDYLFFVGSNSYILPEDQGAYLSYLFPLYLLGIVALVKRFSQSPSSATLILFSLLSAVAVVVITGTVEIYRNPVGLYLVFIIFAFGWELASKYLNKLPKLISIVILVSFLGLAGFQHTKYLLDYFLIYPQSLPLVFGPDTKEIYDFVGQKKDYNLIVDRVYFGPIFAAYYWKLDPRVFQAETEWSQPDPWGWVNPHRLGGIYHGAFGVEELLCRKRDNPEVPIKAIVISDPIPSLGDKASLAAYDASHALRIHEVYDIDELYERLKRPGPCNPK